MSSRAEYNRAKRAEMKEKGICVRCWKRPTEPGHVKCEVCLVDTKARRSNKGYIYKVIDLRYR